MKRYRNWDVKLVQELGPLRGEPMEWGETDCVSLCLRALETMYPLEDMPAPSESERPSWSTRMGALRVLNREPAFHEVLREHGCREVNIRACQQGDIVYNIPQDNDFPGYGVSAEQGIYHVSIGDEKIVWTRLRTIRQSDLDVSVLRPPYE